MCKQMKRMKMMMRRRRWREGGRNVGMQVVGILVDRGVFLVKCGINICDTLDCSHYIYVCIYICRIIHAV